MDELNGKVAVVTGGASGIGRALAEQFLADGMRVMLGDIDGAAVEATAKKLSALGEVAHCAGDVSQSADVDSLRDAALRAFGAVHVVCNNAGVSGRPHATWETTDADWDWVVGVNLMGVVHGARSFGPVLVEQGFGHMVNTASLAGLSAVPFAAPYVATKHAVVGLSQSIALEFEARGVDVGVTVLCPDWLNTGIAESHANWPARLGPRPADSTDPGAQFVETVFTEAVASAPGPEGLARATSEAIRAKRFMVLTDTELVARALTLHAGLLQGDYPTVPV